ncbi:MAG: diguanylate cyclase [Microbacterium sp. SCN 70-200]|uniref:NADPH-dependent F420 reductase n=1 Tax=unclassified Microbacterium TaxID=2609290 RepID=UPI00086B0E7B|nr:MULTISPECIES: diguanylate cyclase [unclassified Microbacterium]MBN9214549.1 diguanylate cyclase [Microbacterium sp.]ODT41443.1 MAG: diguanylate cyclase [Microbacterium sp. SCN 70-200]OJV84077.1 MAG: diguanylate cyclase [Microbacterium sp. 70-16]
MSTITIFGSGNMGQAIAGILARSGASIQHIGSAQTGEQIAGDIVVLAVPYPSIAQITAAYGEQFAGKTIVDITNPLDFSTFDSLVVPAGSSAAAQLQQAFPEAKVLKAFNTNFAATLVSGTVGGEKTTVLVAGDDADAKAALIAAVEAGGVSAVDAGALSRAHELEALGFLQLTLAVGEKVSWTAGFALVK